MSNKQLLGLIGSLVLIIGVFVPVVSMPIVGTMNAYSFERGDGKIVLVLAIISLVLVVIKKYKGLWFTGIASLIMSISTFIYIQSRVASVKAELQTSLSKHPFAGLGESVVNSVQLEWGLAILFIGAVLIISAVAIKESE